MIDSYPTIEHSVIHKITRRKSRFLALVSRADSRAEAQRQLEQARKTYHDATHHCYAFRLLDHGAVVEASHDDGEPAGSAGVPILQQLAGRDLCNVLAIVVRYFGGTKLGVGGLVRAYADATSEALEQTRVISQPVATHVTLRFPIEVNSGVMSTLHRFPVHVEDLVYDELVRVELTVPPSQIAGLRLALIEASAARAEMEVSQ